MHRADRTDFHPIDQLEDIHAHQNLRAHHQNIPQRDQTPPRIRRIQRRVAERHIDEWVHRHDQDKRLGEAGDVVVDEAAAGDFVEGGVVARVEVGHEEGFEDELLDEEEEDEHDGEDQHAEGGELAERDERDVFDVLVARDIGVEVAGEEPGGEGRGRHGGGWGQRGLLVGNAWGVVGICVCVAERYVDVVICYRRRLVVRYGLCDMICMRNNGTLIEPISSFQVRPSRCSVVVVGIDIQVLVAILPSFVSGT